MSQNIFPAPNEAGMAYLELRPNQPPVPLIAAGGRYL
jgi:hypothetical protein